MESQFFAEALRISSTPTPMTKEFEMEYGQKKNRWWDKSTGNQKEHLICWFSRKYFGGSTKKCVENNLSKCKYCYFKETDWFPDYGEETDARKVFERMKKPEMFIYIAEALQVLTQPELENYISETKNTMDTGPNWSDIRKKYLKWEQVELNAMEILKRENKL